MSKPQQLVVISEAADAPEHRLQSSALWAAHKRRCPILALMAVILFFAVIRVRLLNFPLERDEGEYAYSGQLILRGIVPYQLCYTMKLPGTAAVYALIELIFGQRGKAIHLGLLLVNGATIVLVFLLGKKFFGPAGGVVASATYGLLSVAPIVLGFSAHATHFVVLPALGGILLLLQAKESEKLGLFFWSGLLLGLATLMKQPGASFVLFGTFWIAVRQSGVNLAPVGWRRTFAEIALVVLGAVLPIAVTSAIVLRAGLFREFWFWTFSYAREYGNTVSLRRGVQNIWEMSLAVAGGTFLIWLIALLSPILILWNRKTREHAFFLGTFLLFSFAAVCVGFHARNHYFVMILPAVSMLCAGGIVAAAELISVSGLRRAWVALPFAVFICCFLVSVVRKREFLFAGDPALLCRKIHAENPFPEAIRVAEFIKAHSRPNDRIAVFGSEPEIYFESNRLSATGYVYMYPLMEAQPFATVMQKQMISEVEEARPQFLINVEIGSSWLRAANSNQLIFDWLEKYVHSQYRLVGIVDELKQGTEYHWSDAMRYEPKSKDRIFLYEQNPSQR